jgi:hypothetical protein
LALDELRVRLERRSQTTLSVEPAQEIRADRDGDIVGASVRFIE